MKKLLALLLFLIPSKCFGDPTKTIWNPFTGNPDYIVNVASLTLSNLLGGTTDQAAIDSLAGGSTIYANAVAVAQATATLSTAISTTGAAVAALSIATNTILTLSSITAPNIAGGYTTAQNFMNYALSPGLSDGGRLSIVGSSYVSVAAGSGTIKAADNSSPTQTVQFITWASSSNIPIPSTSVRYIGIIYNASTPTVAVHTTQDWDLDTSFALGEAVSDGATTYIQNNPWRTNDALANVIERFDSMAYITRDNRIGGITLGTTGTRNVSVSAGQLLARLEEYPTSAIDTSVIGSSFTAYYRDGAGGWKKVDAQTQFNNSQYDNNSGTLQSLVLLDYVSNWFYLMSDGSLAMVYGQQDNGTLAALLQGDNAPSSLPSRISEMGILIGRIVARQGQTAAVQTQSAFTTTFAGSVVSNHNDLANIQGGSVGEYYHLTNAKYLELSTATAVLTSAIGSTAAVMTTQFIAAFSSISTLQTATGTIVTRLNNLDSSTSSIMIGGRGSVSVYDEGVFQGPVSSFNFVGSVVSVSVTGATATVTVTGGTGGSSLPLAQGATNYRQVYSTGTPYNLSKDSVTYFSLAATSGVFTNLSARSSTSTFLLVSTETFGSSLQMDDYYDNRQITMNVPQGPDQASTTPNPGVSAGRRFYVNNSTDIIVTDLEYSNTYMVASRDVGLYDKNQVLLTSISVTLNGPKDGTWHYARLPTPIRLLAGSTYTVAAFSNQDTVSQDFVPCCSGPGGLTFNGVTFISGQFLQPATSLVFPTTVDASNYWMGPGFRFVYSTASFLVDIKANLTASGSITSGSTVTAYSFFQTGASTTSVFPTFYTSTGSWSGAQNFSSATINGSNVVDVSNSTQTKIGGLNVRGFAGIGTTLPIYPLHVLGSPATGYVAIFTTDTVSNSTYIVGISTGLNNNYGYLDVQGGIQQHYALYCETEAANSQGGTSTANIWMTRTLNCTLAEIGSSITRPHTSSSTITLLPGTYRVWGRSPYYGTNNTQSRLKNISKNSTELVGSSGFARLGDVEGQHESFLTGVITTTGTFNFQFEHNGANTQASNGLGIAANHGEKEVFAEIEFYRIK